VLTVYQHNSAQLHSMYILNECLYKVVQQKFNYECPKYLLATGNYSEIMLTLDILLYDISDD